MTSHDDQAGRSDETELAPVTPLFGRRGAGSADRSAGPRGAAQAAVPRTQTHVDASSAGDAVAASDASNACSYLFLRRFSHRPATSRTIITT